MRKLKLLVLALMALAWPVSRAQAQACLGLPSFTNGSIHLNFAAEFPDSAKAYAVGIGAGRPNGLFANIGGSQVSFEGLDEKATSGFLEFGLQLPISRAQLCPIAGGSYGVGPDDDAAGIKVTTRSASAGLALGLPLGSSSVRFIPNVAVGYEYLSQKVESGGGDFGPSVSLTNTVNSGIVDLGFALVFGDRLSLQPLAHLPFGGDDDEVSFGVFGAVSFGWKPK